MISCRGAEKTAIVFEEEDDDDENDDNNNNNNRVRCSFFLGT
jgi:hypothetical protein